MDFRLHVHIPGEGMRIVRLDRARMAIGRHPESDIVLPGSAVSRCHALLLKTTGGYCIEDLGGYNGVLVGGRRVHATELTPGDEIVIGDNSLYYLAENGEQDRTDVVETFSPLEAQQPWPTLARLRANTDLKSSEEIGILLRAIGDLDGRFSMHEALDQLARELLDSLAADRIVWWMKPPRSPATPLRIERRRSSFIRPSPLGEELLERLRLSGKPLVRKEATEGGVHSWIGAPIPLPRQPGALVAERAASPEAFEPRQLELLVDLARVLAPLIHRWLDQDALSRSYDALARENRALRDALRVGRDFSSFLGHSPPVRRLIRQAEAWVDATGPLLLYGEPGSGRQQMAQLLHFNRTRAWGPMIVVDCHGSASELQATLLGTSKAPGALEGARGGTILWCHLEKAPRELAGPLTRVLRTGTFEHDGHRRRVAETRFLALLGGPPGNCRRRRPELTDLIDTFEYRLGVPPLRRASTDVPILADAYLTQAGAHIGKRLPGIEPEASERLIAHDWPGNRRELEALMTCCAFRLRSGRALGLDVLSQLLPAKGEAEGL
ncbi:MAG: FHA domain-containing protein [Planctomycetota bacterium]